MGQMLTIPYARQRAVDNSDYIRAMSEMMLRRGDMIAEATRARGAANMAAWGNVGNVVGSTFAGIGQQRDQELKLQTLKEQQAIENALREREFQERKADREADVAWRQQQAEKEQNRYLDTIAQQQADDVKPGTPVDEATFNALYKGRPASSRFNPRAAIPAQPAWETEPVGDAMAEGGPAMPAVPMSYMRKPTGQEALQLEAAELARQDRVTRDRQFTLNQGQEDERARQAQANADRAFNEGRRQFGITEGRLSDKDKGGLFGFAGFEGLSGPEILEKLPPADAALMKNILDYRSDITKVTSLRGDQRMRVAQLAMMIDPTFDMTQYNVRSKLRADFTSGKTSTNLKSMNQLVGHLSDLEKNATAMGNTRIPLFNTVKNEWNLQTGDDRVNNFAATALAVENELAAVFKGTGATDQEIDAWRERLHSNMSPTQLTGFVKTAIGLMGSRLSSTLNQYEQGMGKPKDFDILSPKTRKTLKAWGFNDEEFEPRAPYVPGEAVESDPADFDFFSTIRRRQQADQPPLIGPGVQVPSQQFKFRPGGG